MNHGLRKAGLRARGHVRHFRFPIGHFRSPFVNRKVRRAAPSVCEKGGESGAKGARTVADGRRRWGLSETFGLLPAPLPPPLIVETKSIAAALGPCRAAIACLSARGAGRAKKRAPEGSSDSRKRLPPAAGRAVVWLAGGEGGEAKGGEREEKREERAHGRLCVRD